METTSKGGQLNKEDIKRWLNNTLIFISPVVLVYLASVTKSITEDGLSLSSFKISSIVAGAIVLYVINVLTDLFRKLSKDNTPKV